MVAWRWSLWMVPNIWKSCAEPPSRASEEAVSTMPCFSHVPANSKLTVCIRGIWLIFSKSHLSWQIASARPEPG